MAEDGDLLVALDTRLTPELEAEGLAREVAHRLQNLRKAAGYEISDRVLACDRRRPQTCWPAAPHRDWLAEELLATELHARLEAALDAPDRTRIVDHDGGRTLRAGAAPRLRTGIAYHRTR